MWPRPKEQPTQDIPQLFSSGGSTLQIFGFPDQNQLSTQEKFTIQLSGNAFNDEVGKLTTGLSPCEGGILNLDPPMPTYPSGELAKQVRFALQRCAHGKIADFAG